MNPLLRCPANCAFSIRCLLLAELNTGALHFRLAQPLYHLDVCYSSSCGERERSIHISCIYSWPSGQSALECSRYIVDNEEDYHMIHFQRYQREKDERVGKRQMMKNHHFIHFKKGSPLPFLLQFNWKIRLCS